MLCTRCPKIGSKTFADPQWIDSPRIILCDQCFDRALQMQARRSSNQAQSALAAANLSYPDRTQRQEEPLHRRLSPLFPSAVPLHQRLSPPFPSTASQSQSFSTSPQVILKTTNPPQQIFRRPTTIPRRKAAKKPLSPPPQPVFPMEKIEKDLSLTEIISTCWNPTDQLTVFPRAKSIETVSALGDLDSLEILDSAIDEMFQ